MLSYERQKKTRGLKEIFYKHKRDTPTKIFSMMYNMVLLLLNKTYSNLVILPFYKILMYSYFLTKIYWSQETHIPTNFVQFMISPKMFIGIATQTKICYKDLTYKACNYMCTPPHMSKTSETCYVT